MVYARSTKVHVDKTRYEIERTLKRYGADQFTYASDDDRGMAVIQFRSHGRSIRFVITLPNSSDKQFHWAGCRRRTPIQVQDAVEQAGRSIWRALLICVKAKLESVESKIETFEQAFMAHVVLPDGSTVADWLEPQLKIAYDSEDMPQTFLALPAPSKETDDDQQD